MRTIRTDDPLSVAVVEAIHIGDVAALKRMLRENPGLVIARLGADDSEMTRTLLHVVTDWPTPDETTQALWYVCHGGQQDGAEYLLESGADLNWVSTWADLTPLDVARRAGANQLVQRLRGRAAKSAADLT